MRTTKINRALASLNSKSNLDKSKQKLIVHSIKCMREIKRAAKLLSEDEQMLQQKTELITEVIQDADNIILCLALYAIKEDTKFGIDNMGKSRIIIENPDISVEIETLTTI